MFRYAYLCLMICVLAACGGGSGGGSDTPPASDPDVAVSGGAVKGPLVDAVVQVYELDTSAESLQGALIAEGSTGADAAIEDLEVPANISGYFLVEFIVDENTVDISTGTAPIFDRLTTVASATDMLASTSVYATPLTTMAVGLAQANADSSDPYAGNGDDAISETEFLDALDVAQELIKSTLGFGLSSDVDIFSTPPLITDDTDTVEEQTEVVEYRQAIEAVAAVMNDLAEDNAGVNSAQTALDAVVEDLSDGEIDGMNGDEEITVLTDLDTDIETIVEDTDLSTLTIPGTDTLVSDIEAVLAEEVEVTGTEADVEDLELDLIEVDLEPANTSADTDQDGVLNSEDAFPEDPNESLDTDADGIGNNADPDDDNDEVLDEQDAFPLDSSESEDFDQDGIGNNADTDDDGDSVLDEEDAFPFNPEESVDTDMDGVGNNEDTDDDNDGISDDEDEFPEIPAVTVLNVTVSDGGRVVTIESQVAAIDCGEVCTYENIGGIEQILAAVSDDPNNYEFESWENCAEDSGNLCFVSLGGGETLNLAANFTLIGQEPTVIENADLSSRIVSESFSASEVFGDDLDTVVSSDSNVAFVSSEGEIQAIGKGAADISATDTQGNTQILTLDVIDPEFSFRAWVGESDTEITFDEGASGIDFYRSRDEDCDVENYLLCDLGQLDVVDGETIVDTAANLSNAGHYVYNYGANQTTSSILSADTFEDRTGFGVTVFNGKIWVIGGFIGITPQNDVWSSVDGDHWVREVADAPFVGRQFHQLVVHDERLWLIGGEDGNDHRNDVWSSADGISWTEETSAADFSGRTRHLSYAYNGKMFVTGGWDNSFATLTDVWSSEDGINWTLENSDFPSLYNDYDVVDFDDKLWLFSSNGGGPRASRVWSTTDGATWTLEIETPEFSDQGNFQAEVYEDQIWLFTHDAIEDHSWVWTSPDGLNWTKISGGILLGNLVAIDANILVFKDELFIVGGDREILTETNEVWSSTDSQNWIARGPGGFVSAREGHTLTSHDGKLWAIGGIDGNGYYGDVWSSEDGINWVLETAEAEFGARSDHATLSFDDKLWVIGGKALRGVGGIIVDGDLILQFTSSAILDDVWYSEDGVTWTEASALPFGERRYPSATVFDDRMWIVSGGEDEGEGIYPDVWYSYDGENWTQATGNAAFEGRIGHSLAVLNGRMWLSGGKNTTEEFTNGPYTPYEPHVGDMLNDVWSSADGVTWTEETDAAGFIQRTYHQMLAHDNKLWVMGGQAYSFSTTINGDPVIVEENDIWSSSDGETWTEVAENASFEQRANFRAAILGDTIFVTGGYGSGDSFSGEDAYLKDVWSSQDGENWREGFYNELLLITTE